MLLEVAGVGKFMLSEVAKIGNFRLPKVETFLCKKLTKLANSRLSNSFQNWPCNMSAA